MDMDSWSNAHPVQRTATSTRLRRQSIVRLYLAIIDAVEPLMAPRPRHPPDEGDDAQFEHSVSGDYCVQAVWDYATEATDRAIAEGAQRLRQLQESGPPAASAG